jgi:small subunit ribosomal protein S1
MDSVQTETSVENPAQTMVNAVEDEGAQVVAQEPSEPSEKELPAEAIAGSAEDEDAGVVAQEPSEPSEEELPAEAMAGSAEDEDAGVVAQEPSEPSEEELPAEAMAGSAEDEDAGVVAQEPSEPSEEELPAEAMAGSVEEEGAGVAVPDEADASEMGELPVEDWDYQRPRRGEVRPGIILTKGEQEIIVDVGAKRDGIVPFADMQRMGAEAIAALKVGDELPVYIMRPEDQDGNLLVSLYLARQEQAWVHAQELADSGEVWEEEVIGFNKGGLVVPVNEIRGFVPASQVPGFPLGLSQEDRLTRLSSYVGETLQVKVIEINRRKRRLILSATAAQRQWRQRQRERLLEDLREGEVRKGVVSSLASFGAFVDLGGADGLVHLSELSWRRIRHPREVVKVGEEVEVYVLRLDHDNNRIGLSLKRLQPEPWALVEDKYELGQLVEGVVTNAVDFGAFAEIEEGVEGLIHVSELADTSVSHPREVVKKGDLLLLRIIRIDVRRKRLGLSLKRVLESEWSEWAARLALEEAEKRAAAEEAEEELEPAGAVEALEEADEVEEEPEPVASEEALGEEEEAEEEPEPAGAVEALEEADEVEEEPEPVASEEALEEEEEAEEEPEPAAAVEPLEEAPAAAVEPLEEADEVEEEPEPVASEEALEEEEEAEEEPEPVASEEALEEEEEAEEEPEPAAAVEPLEEAEEPEPVASVEEAGQNVEETETSSDLPEDEAQTSEGSETFGEAESSTEEDLELAVVEA